MLSMKGVHVQRQCLILEFSWLELFILDANAAPKRTRNGDKYPNADLDNLTNLISHGPLDHSASNSL